MPPRARKQIEVTQAPPRRDQTSIPESVVDYFLTKGLHLSWGSRMETAIAKSSIDERFPVNIESDVDDAEMREEIKATLRRYGSRVGPDGTVIRGDCYLFCQSAEARERSLLQAAEGWQRHNDPNWEEAFADEQTKLIADPKIGRVQVSDGAGLSRFG